MRCYAKQENLFNDDPVGTNAWRPPETLPELGQFKCLGFDTETTGLDTWKDLPVGISLHTPDDKRYYLPWGHRGGGNLDEAAIKRWAKAELRGKELRGANLKFDHHVMLNWGVDLEAQGCRLRDVQYQAALLDDHRRSVKLDTLAQEILGRRKLELPEKSRISDLPAAMVGPYAEEDAALADALFEAQQLKIVEEGLERVQDLEDDLTYVTCYMERQGAPIDVQKLGRWRSEVTGEYSRIIIQLAQESGIRVNPNSAESIGRLYTKLQKDFPRTVFGAPSFTEDFLSKGSHPWIKMVQEARQLDSLRSKYLDKYTRALTADGRLRYQLHQLRGDEYGTISGRYSSANVNIQQVFSEERQAAAIAHWIIRELFVPAAGTRWCRADASQIEFRLAAHYANAERIIKAYNEDPLTDFHAVVALIVHQDRKRAKNTNFGKIYGMGRNKMAAMIGLPRREEVDSNTTLGRYPAGTQTADDVFEEYDREFPEMRRLMNRVMRVVEDRGYVRTLLGRRARFPDRQRLHSALNKVIQGTAADIMKLKLLELHRERRNLGFVLRFTVHDEVDGDLENPERAKDLKELLDAPCLPLKVPIRWEVKVGDNWRLKT